MGKSSSSKLDTSVLTKNTPQSMNNNLNVFGSVGSKWNPNTQSVDSSMNLSDPLKQGLSNAWGQYNNLDQRLGSAGQQAVDANYAPMQRKVEQQMGDYFAGLGASGRRNSKGIDAFARMGSELADNSAKSMYDMQNQARNQSLSELGQQYNAFLNPSMQMMGMAGQGSSQLASGQQQLGQQLMQAQMQQAQMDAQEKQQRKAAIGSGVGSVLGLGTKMIGGGM